MQFFFKQECFVGTVIMVQEVLKLLYLRTVSYNNLLKKKPFLVR